MGKPDAPEAPDPKKTSAAQTGTSVATALANTMMGNVNQVGPDGSTLTYDQTGTYVFRDPFTKKKYKLPTFTATTSLSPEAQAIYDTNQETQGNLAQLGADQSSFLGEYLSEPFSYDAGDHEKWAMGLYDNINGESVAADRSAMEAKLANQGLVPGSEAYDAAMKSVYSGQQEARDKFMLDSFKTGMNAAQMNRSQPLNEIISLMSGTQVQMPGFQMNTPSSIPTTDNAGLINTKYQQDLAAWERDMAQRGNIMGGLFGLASGGLAGGYF